MWKLELNVSLLNVDEIDEREGEEEFAKRDNKDVRHRRVAYAPTLKERLEHARTHIPYRSLCKTCVAVRGLDTQHRSKQKDERDVASVALDYCFLRNESGGEYVPVIVMKDYDTKIICAHVVPARGADTEWVDKQLARDLEKLGHHGRVVLKRTRELQLSRSWPKLLNFAGTLKHCLNTLQWATRPGTD